jgi:hypothetical protein
LVNYLSKIFQRGIAKDELEKTSIQLTLKAYQFFYDKNRSDLSHYFRTYYHLIKFIDNSEIKNKRQYASIARAQLSSYEQVILFYNCLHDNGNEKFKPLIEKYALLKNLDHSYILNLAYLSEYEQSAYGYE